MSAVILTGFATSVALVALAFAVRRRNVVVLTLIVNALSTVQYALLGATSSALMAGVGLVFVALVFWGGQWASSKQSVAVATSALVAVHLVVSDSLVGVALIALVASVMGLIPVVLHNQVAIKLTQIMGCATWLSFSLVVGAYGQVPGQVFTLVLSVATVVYVTWYKRHHDTAEVPELTTVIKQAVAR